MKWLVNLLILSCFSLFLGSNALASENLKREWGSTVTLLTTVAYGGTTADFKSTTYVDSNKIDLNTNGYDGCVISIDYDPNGTTDYPVFSIYEALGGTLFDISTSPLYSINGANTAGNADRFSIVIKDCPYFMLRYKSSGTTDFIGCKIRYRPWRQKTSRSLP